MAININEELIKAGTKYRKELLAMPVAALGELLKYVTLKTGLQGKEIGGVLTTDAELRPYRSEKGDVDNTKVDPFEWENFLGDVVKEFDPHAILGSLYTELTSKGVKEYDFVKRVALEMARKVGAKLYDSAFVAKRKADGNTTLDLFNGWTTLALAAIAAGKMTSGKNNFMDLSETPFTVDNVGDKLKYAWRNSQRNLKKEKSLMYLPVSVIEMYEDWFQVEYGHAAWNNRFEQMTLVGSRGKCTFAPLDNMEDQNLIYISVKENMKVGVDQKSDNETVRIRECDNPKMVQFFMKAYFGTGFETIEPEYMNAIKFATEEAPALP